MWVSQCFYLNFNESTVRVWDVEPRGELSFDRPGFEAAQLCGLSYSLRASAYLSVKWGHYGYYKREVDDIA